MNRRDFLQPRHLVQTAGQLLAAADELSQLQKPEACQEFTMLRFSRRAMATQFEIVLPLGTREPMMMASEALDEIDRLEDQLTVYRPQSEVSLLNLRAPDAPQVVEALLFDLLQRAAVIHRATQGAFDITAGALIKAWGFYRGPRRVPTVEERRNALQHVGMQHLLLDAAQRTVHFLRRGLEINLGAIGKGYALDRTAELLREKWNLTSGVLHGGHSSVYAIGTEPGDERGWTVGIGHPWNPQKRLAVLHLRDQAMGTSAATFQHLEYNGRKLGHILDPRTGWPAEGIASATVVAPTAAEADALATAFFVLGLDRAKEYCSAHPAVSAILLPDGEATQPVVLGQNPPPWTLVAD